MKKRIYCTVTNDLTYDQRMIRICTSLQKAGYAVCLVGRQRKSSKPLLEQPFEQKRLKCWFNKGKWFYLEYNIRLFFYLLFSRLDAVCAIDLDTLLAGYYSSKFKRKLCVYDAHEYFTELPELVNRPSTQKIWKGIANRIIPKLQYCYTVCDSLAKIFEEKYKTPFEVIRNVPFRQPLPKLKTATAPYILLYQGALNDGRGLEEMITAMQHIEQAEFWMAGEGDLSQELRVMVTALKLEQKVKFLGYVQPHELKDITLKADIGINLLQNKGLNYYYSLANKFFDYMQVCKPSMNMQFPEYQKLIEEHEVGVLLPDLEIETIIKTIQKLVGQPTYYAQLQEACLLARQEYIWEKEELKLTAFWKNMFV